jgi:hypothetical protein
MLHLDGDRVTRDGDTIVTKADVSTDVWMLILAGLVAVDPDGPIVSAHTALTERPRQDNAPYRAAAYLDRYIKATRGAR